MRRLPCAPRRESGMMLIEALVAILIFSIGILALVGLQATAVKQSTDARYRAEAAALASELIAEMWVSNRDPATLKTNFEGTAGSGGGLYAAWATRVGQVLPGATGVAAPTVVVDGAGTALPGSVFVTLTWLAPNEPATATPHSYVTRAVIR